VAPAEVNGQTADSVQIDNNIVNNNIGVDMQQPDMSAPTFNTNNVNMSNDIMQTNIVEPQGVAVEPVINNSINEPISTTNLVDTAPIMGQEEIITNDQLQTTNMYVNTETPVMDNVENNNVTVNEPINAFNSVPTVEMQSSNQIEELNVNNNVDNNISNNIESLEQPTVVIPVIEPISQEPILEQKRVCKNCGAEMPSIVMICPKCGTDNE